MSAPVKASLWFVICNVLQKGVSLITTPIFTRLLTTEQYGIFSVYQSWYSIVSIIATLNLSAGVYNNGLTKFSNDKKRLTSSFLGLSTIVTFILFDIYIINMNFFNQLLQLSTIFVMAMFIQLLFEPAYLLWSTGERYNYRYKKLIAVTLMITLGTPIVGVIAVLSTSYKAEARVLSSVCVGACIGIAIYIYSMMRGKTFFKKEYWKFALMFNIPLIPHYLSMTILNQADRIMISRMVGNSEAAIYSIAYTVSMMMTIVTNAVNNSYIPYSYKAIKSKNYDGIRKNTNLLIVLISCACIIAMAFGPEIIKIVAPKKYYDAVWIIPPVAASVYFMFLYNLFGNVEFYFEKTKFIMIASCIGAIANVILNYIFIPIYGYYAAGYTTLCCYILFSFAHYFFHKKVLNEKLPNIKEIYDMHTVIGISIILLVAMIGITITYTNIFIRYVIIAILFVLIVIKHRTIINQLKELKK